MGPQRVADGGTSRVRSLEIAHIVVNKFALRVLACIARSRFVGACIALWITYAVQPSDQTSTRSSILQGYFTSVSSGARYGAEHFDAASSGWVSVVIDG